MSGNFSDVIEQCGEKHKCSEEELRHIERLWIDTAKALEYIIDTSRFLNHLLKSAKDSKEDIPASVKLCEECMNDINRLLALDCGKNLIGDTGTGCYDLTKLLAKASEIYAASINRTVRTLLGGVSSIEKLSRKECDFSKEALQKMENFCKYQADVSYSAAEISAYFKNLVRSLKNKK